MKLKNDWEFNVLNIYNFNKFGNLKYYFDFIKKNHRKIKGDIVEAGVFQGRSLLATALFLKKLKSNKKVFGFDTFSGFPIENEFHRFDTPDNWKKLKKDELIDNDHYFEVKKNEKILKFVKKNKFKKLSYRNLSLSSDFSENSITTLKKKIKFLGLNNIKLIKGDFKTTFLQKKNLPENIFCSIIDADLYRSYYYSLPQIYERLSKGGYLYLDEYYSLKFPGPRLYCNAFAKNHKIKIYKEKRLDGDFPRYFILKN